jgi:hypothetical protein
MKAKSAAILFREAQETERMLAEVRKANAQQWMREKRQRAETARNAPLTFKPFAFLPELIFQRKAS